MDVEGPWGRSHQSNSPMRGWTLAGLAIGNCLSTGLCCTSRHASKDGVMRQMLVLLTRPGMLLGGLPLTLSGGKARNGLSCSV